MYPYEMSFDKDGIGYIDLKQKCFPLFEMKFEDNEFRLGAASKKTFYLLPSTGEYLMKVNNRRNHDNREIYQMIKKLLILQSRNQAVDFPIGYVCEGELIIGQIIRHYQGSKSLRMIYNQEDLSSLQKYIYRDDDSLHNLFLVYEEILEKLEELFHNGVGYLDIHAGNFVFYQDQVKIIDFDPKYIFFDKLNYREEYFVRNYIKMINEVNCSFGLSDGLDYLPERETFSKIKSKVLELENKLRKKNY